MRAHPIARGNRTGIVPRTLRMTFVRFESLNKPDFGYDG
jgi:hypothetical protein